MTKWRPIETAPKDGSAFMVWGYYSQLAGLQPTKLSEVDWGVATMRWNASTYEAFEEAEGGLYRKVQKESGYMSALGGGYATLQATHWAPMLDGPREMPNHRGAFSPRAALGMVAE